MRRYGATGSVTRSRMEDCNSSMHKTMPTLMLDKAERKALAALLKQVAGEKIKGMKTIIEEMRQ